MVRGDNITVVSPERYGRPRKSGGPSSVANAVNESGEVAGQSDLSSGFTNGFLWTSGGGLQSIGIQQGGQQSGANAMNASGQIAGVGER